MDRVYRGQSVAVATAPESRLRRIRNVKDRPVIGESRACRRARDLLRPPVRRVLAVCSGNGCGYGLDVGLIAVSEQLEHGRRCFSCT